jgi:hypothetical protein
MSGWPGAMDASTCVEENSKAIKELEILIYISV